MADTNQTTAGLTADRVIAERAYSWRIWSDAHVAVLVAEIERLRSMLPPHPGLWFHEADGTVREPSTRDT